MSNRVSNDPNIARQPAQAARVVGGNTESEALNQNGDELYSSFSKETWKQ